MKTPPVLGTQPGGIIKWADVDQDTQYHGLYPAQLRAAAAEWYAAKGLEVGPLNGKAPMGRYVPRGLYSFTADVGTVRAWWHSAPGANIGLRPPAGYVVVDVDVKDGAPGAQTWRQVTAGRSVPDTLTMTTGSGGWHFWFRLPYEGKLRGNLVHSTSGIDLQPHNKQVVAAPSVHPDNGGLYQLHKWMELDEVPLLPVWLHGHVYKPAAPPREMPRRARHAGSDLRAEGLIRTVAEAVKGTRNSILNWAAYEAAKAGMEIQEELVAAALLAGLDERRARATVASGTKGGGAAA